MSEESSEQLEQPVVEMWTDGACKGNPGVGGWGVLMRSGEHTKELFGGEAMTTNNRMELTAVIEGLGVLNRRCAVPLHVDSTYVMNGHDRAGSPGGSATGGAPRRRSP